MPAKLSSSIPWFDWVCRFDQNPSQQEIDAARQGVQNYLNNIISIYNNSLDTFPVTLELLFEWTSRPQDQFSQFLRCYLQGGPNRPGPGGNGAESIKNPPPPPPPPPL